jgi:hypothetical protein
MLFAIVASRVYKHLAAIAPNESGVCGYSDLVHFLGAPASLVAMGDAMPEACASDHPQKLFVFPFGCVYISLRRATNGHICTLDSGGVLALHL